MNNPHELLAGYISLAAYAEVEGVSTRTVYNRIASGLPYVRLGNKTLISVEKARAWIDGLACQRNQPRSRRGRAAA